jgi:hypothetical protein
LASSGLQDNPTQPHPHGEQDENAEYKYQEPVHDLVVSDVD